MLYLHVACPHPAVVPFGLSDIEYRLVCLSPPWVVLVLSLRLSAVRFSSLPALSLRCRWHLTVAIYPG